VRAFTQDFPFIQDVKRKAVQQWVNRQAKGGKKAATISRSLSELRGYWSYLTSVEAVPKDSLPLEKLSVPRPSNKDNGGEEVRQPFTAKEVMSLLNAAVEREDSQLADLIRLGMWTGARLEELSALKVKDVNPVYFEVKDAKSAAGRRQIPIHSKLKTTMRRLIRDSKDGCILSGLSANKYKDRGNAVGKRFGRLKTAMGFGEAHVFHLIRKKVATMLENAGVVENVAADIIGHDKPTMTYGLCSGGNSLKVKQAAIEKLNYGKV
jgi:integrase